MAHDRRQAWKALDVGILVSFVNLTPSLLVKLDLNQAAIDDVTCHGSLCVNWPHPQPRALLSALQIMISPCVYRRKYIVYFDGQSIAPRISDMPSGMCVHVSLETTAPEYQHHY